MGSTTFLKRLIRPLAGAAFWLAVWQLAAWRVGVELLLPAPLTVAQRLWALAGTGAFWTITGLSLGRILLGLAWGSVAGILLAVLTCTGRWWDALFAPAIRVVRAVPVASFILLVLLWTGRDVVPVVISGLMVLPVVWEGVCQGIRSADPQLLEAAGMYRLSRAKTARLVVIPAVKPHLRAALDTAMGLAWKSGVAAEALCWPKKAIGTQIYNTKLYLETADLFAWTVVVILLSLLLERGMRAVLRLGERGRRL